MAGTLACRRCRATLDPDARFCGSCGAEAATRVGSGASLQVSADHLAGPEERRVVTVLFADLIGSTTLAERLDPEDLRRMLGELFEALSAEVSRLDGTVDKYVGDAIMAVFGAPVAHEDDPIRAVAAAAAMHERLGSLNDGLEKRYGARLELKVGINTGEVVAGALSGDAHAYTVVGDTVNTAHRLQAAARSGEILVGEKTRRLAERAFEFDDRGTIEAKGKTQPVAAYAFVRRVADASRATIAIIGRTAEREALRGALQELRAGTGGVAAIVGDPGIGKTRLLAEMRDAARESNVVWLEGHATSFGRSISYVPFRDVILAFAGVSADDDDPTRWSKLSDRVRDVVPDADEIIPYLGAMLSLRMPDEAEARVGRGDGDAMRRQVFSSVYVLFEGIARAAPTVVAFEDWHWVDRSSEQLFEHLLPLTDRLLLVYTGRLGSDPPTTERTAQACRTARGDAFTELALAPLSEAESSRLVATILGMPNVPAGLRDPVVRRCEGNPFFAEELLRTFQDLRLLARDGSAWVVTEHRETAVPTSVQGVIAARVDRLPQGAREIARTASVIGRTFPQRVLEAVEGSRGDLDAALAELERRSILRQIGGAERSWTFRHALLHETIYGGILVARRRELHDKVGAAIEALWGDSSVELAGALAYHYARAESWEKAQRYLFQMADEALRIAADAEAVDHYERALAAYARAFGYRWDPLERARIERKIGEARYRLGDVERAVIHLDRALDLLGFARPRDRGRIRRAIAWELTQQLAHRIAPAVFQRRLRPSPAHEEILQTLWVLQFIDYSIDLERLMYDILRTLNLVERLAPSHRTARAYLGMTTICDNVGLRGMGRRYAGMARRLADALGDPIAVASAHASTALDHYANGRWDPAAAEFAAASEGFRLVGDLNPWAAVMGYANMILVVQGRLGEAMRVAEQLERTGHTARDSRVEAVGWHCRAHVLEFAGRVAEARDGYERALSRYRSISDHNVAVAVTGAFARLLVRQGDDIAARALVDDGMRMMHEHRLRGWLVTDLLAAAVDLHMLDARRGGADAARALDAARHDLGRLRRQARLHADALPPALRAEGELQWLRGREKAARMAWRRSIAAAEQLGAITEVYETHLVVAAWTSSPDDRAAAERIAAQLREALPRGSGT